MEGDNYAQNNKTIETLRRDVRARDKARKKNQDLNDAETK